MRKLVTIRKVKELKPIKNADFIELAIVDGWQCVVKKGEFSVGDIGVYFEIDSFLPLEPEFQFLEKSCKKKMGNEEGLRLRTIKLKGEISQGLLLPLTVIKRFLKGKDLRLEIGTELTEILGVKKYDPPIPAQLAGQVKGNFPSFLKKTEQERIQNLFDKYSNNEEIKNLTFEESLKLDGTSCTYYVANIEKFGIEEKEDMDIQNGLYFGHCSRNLETKEGDSTPWQIARDLKIKEELLEFSKRTGRNIAFQGELMGPKIQGNRENLKSPEFFLFEIWDIDNQKYLTPKERETILGSFTNIKQVPILNKESKPFETFKTVQEFLEYAKGPSIYHKIREGLVYKSNELVNGQNISFKVINNDFLLKGGD